ncbi:hypothetical protein G9A89_005218 [Geosiphon pyriformis]|nr:hypothetical protein G9A89_005218 [Geosiphon pyriformis]
MNALVDYTSSSEGESENEKETRGKRARTEEEEEEMRKRKFKQELPPLPSSFLELYTNKVFSTTKSIDDPSKHNGRIRSSPHVEGNWPTHVFVEVDIDPDFQELIYKIKQYAETVISQYDHDFKLFSCVRNNGDVDEKEIDIANNSGDIIKTPFIQTQDLFPVATQEFGTSSLNKTDDAKLHISLSRSIFLKYHQIQIFWEKIRQAVYEKKRFSLSFAKIECFMNDEATRSFLAFEVGKGYNELKELLLNIDSIVSDFSQPRFYENPRFHASILWAIKDNIDRRLRDTIIGANFEDEIRQEIFIINSVRCHIGNKQYIQDLSF